jgi:hypothetical protein
MTALPAPDMDRDARTRSVHIATGSAKFARSVADGSTSAPNRTPLPTLGSHAISDEIERIPGGEAAAEDAAVHVEPGG